MFGQGDGSVNIRTRRLPDGTNWKTTDIARLIYNTPLQQWEILRLGRVMASSQDKEALCQWGNQYFNLIEAHYDD